jgi:hypothetical protein
MMPLNQPPRPGNESCKYKIINCPGHPSFKRRGNLFWFPYLHTPHKINTYASRGMVGQYPESADVLKISYFYINIQSYETRQQQNDNQFQN